ncbi:MAG TPA: chromosomal replication initiator protein DnaA [Phycisphaerales bacterium]|nr:chromosomal replication initiator protein DnaA [Phycisphaerales bacterium]
MAVRTGSQRGDVGTAEHDRQTLRTILEHLRRHQPGLCRQWFEEIEPLGVLGGVLRLRAHSRVHRDYLQRQCVDQFKEAAQAVSGRLLSVQFLGPEDDAPAQPVHAESTQPLPEPKAGAASPVPLERAGGLDRDAAPSVSGGRSAEPGGQAAAGVPGAPARHGAEGGRGDGGVAARPGEGPTPGPVPSLTVPRARSAGLSVYSDSLVINPDYSFEHFVVGPANRLAHAAALAVASNPGRAYNPYFVHGDVGLGKTHLLQAICLKIHETAADARIYYTSCEGFTTQFMDAVQAGEMNKFRHKFRDVDVLVIDDIHFLAKRDRTQEEFFHTFNSLYQAHKQIILSSDAPPEEIPDLEDRLVSRFKWGLVTSVDTPSFETRIEILKNKARLRGFELPNDVASHVAARIDTNIRELEGVIIKLQVLGSVEQRPIDLALARTALGEQDERPEKPVQLGTIVDAVIDFYGVKLTDLQSKRRPRSIVLPRQVCMYLARELTGLSLEQIGLHFGGRDHTTAMHAINTIRQRCQASAEFAETIRGLQERVRDSSR